MSRIQLTNHNQIVHNEELGAEIVFTNCCLPTGRSSMKILNNGKNRFKIA